MESSPVDAIRAFVLLVTAASVVGVVAGRIRLPYAVGLVLLGLAAGYVLPEAARGITPDLVLAVLLPGLIFEASFRTPLEPFRWAVSRVVVLAVPGVILTALVVAVVVHLGTGISLGSCLLIGAMVCATDPASVVSTFRRVAAPDRLRTLVEGESLLNDGTSLVIFVVALRIVTGGLGAGDAAIFFVTTLAISALIGGVLGFVTVQVLRTVDDHVLEATITIACAYGAAVIADGLGESGIIATAVAGLVVGTYGRRVALSAETKQALDEVWEVAAFVLAALIFLIVGAAIPLPRLLADAGPVAVGVVAVLVARLLTVYGLLGLGERVIERARRGRPSFASSVRAAAGARWSLAGPEGPSVVPLAWLHVLSFAGLRGSVTVALALALPAGLPDRAAVQTLTFGIVVVTLLVFGLLARPFVGWALGRAPAEPGGGTPATPGGGTPATPGAAGGG
ncbi:MAG TPA: sodium:proton antiporter [Candidatus Limnocylindrales bacterium]